MTTDPNQTNAMVSYPPGMTWFPHVLKFTKVSELVDQYDDERLDNPSAAVVDVILEDKPIAGEIFTSPNGLIEASFVAVLESRPAKGDWSAEFWKGVKPTWYRCLCMYEKFVKK